MKKSTLFLKQTIFPVSLSFWLLFFFTAAASFAQSEKISVLADQSNSKNLSHNSAVNDYYTTFDEDDCSQETLSNNFQNALGTLHQLQIANDFTVNPNESFTLNSMSFNGVVDFGETISAVNVYFYQDSGDGPGEAISSISSVTPSSDESVGENFGLDFREITIEFEDPISFIGSSSESVFWVGIQIEYTGANSYMEVTTNMNTPNSIYYLDNDTSLWVKSSPDVELNLYYDGVISLYGECIELDGCTGQPDAGHITGGETMEICKNIGFGLNVSGATQAAGLLYQWQQKTPEEEDWTDIEDANELSLQIPDGITIETQYRFRIECENNEEFDFTDPVTVTVKPTNECYCTPVYTTGCISNDNITNVSLTGESESIDNDSECSENAYGDYTDLTPADLAPGETYTLSVSTGYSSPTSEQVRAWIDFNQDGQFSEEEEIANSQGDGLEGGTGNFEFEVPENIVPGDYRLRVRLGYSTSAPTYDACESVNYGEAEDYMVEIIQLNQCQDPVSAGEPEETDLNVCANIPFLVAITGASNPADGLTRQWQSSPTGEDDWTDIENANSNNYTVSEGIDEPTNFRYKVVCNDGTPAYSDIIEVNLNPANECYCIPTYENGCGYGDRITNVSLSGESNTINNDSECSENAYGDYTDLTPADLAPGETYTLSVSTDYSSPTSENVRAWIDYNDNGNFEDDEEIANSQGSGLGSGTEQFEFTVPENLNPGNYRMRVRLDYGSSDIEPCNEASHGETEDYTVEVIELNDCQDPVSAGEVQDTALEVCAGINFTLVVTGASDPANNLTRQWQSSPAGEDDWTAIEGANSNTYVVSGGVEEPTDFRYKVVCGEGDPDYSDLVEVTLKPGEECYCTPIYTAGCDSDQINNVTLIGESETIDNDSGCSPDAFGDYTDLTPADLAPGENYTLSVHTNYFFPNSEQMKAWIDFNQNGTFEDGEEIANTQGNGFPSNGTATFNFQIPEDAEPGEYRMRVRLVYGFSTDFNACDSQLNGETEDYTVEIIDLENCEGTPTAGTIDDDFEVCAGNPFDISASGASMPTNGLERIWQFSPAGEDNWTDIEGANSPTYSSMEGIEEPTDFRFKVTCTFSEETDISDVITISLKPAIECYCIPENNSNTVYYINNVSTEGALQDIDNTSGFSNNGYEDYSDTEIIMVYPGQEFDYSIMGNNTLMDYGIWLDLNQNGTFDEPSEMIGSSSNAIDGPFIGSYQVPTDLEEGNYRLRVRVNWLFGLVGPCEDSPYGETEDYTLQVVTLDCFPPQNIQVDYITDVSAQVNWNANDEDAWVVIYGETGFDPEEEGTTIEVADNPSVDLTDLNDDTAYDVYIKTTCDEDESIMIGPIKFTTNITPPENTRLCDAIALTPNNGCIDGPYSNVAAFEETDEPIGSCHNNFRGTNTVWFTFTATADGQATITTDFDNTAIQTEIVVFEAPTDCEDMSTLGEEVGCAAASDEGVIELIGLNPGETYYVKVAGFNSAAGLFCIEVQMDETPVCFAPTEIEIGEIGEDTIDVSWTAGGNETQWEVIYDEVGFNPEIEGESVVVNTTEATLINLTPETDYEVYVRAICTNLNSDLAGPETFTTGPMSVDSQVFGDFTYYPNPVKDQLILKAGSQIESIEVYNLLGQSVISTKPNSLDAQINTEALQSGVYLMEVRINGSHKMFRLSKK